MTYPQAIAFGARALEVPGRGSVMCASAFVPFRLADGELLRPADWYGVVRDYGGEDAVPDVVAPLPGAELLLLGGVAPLAGDRRECTIRCGALERRLLLRSDPEWTGSLPMRADAALWHEQDNPEGRGGPGDTRRPLIVDERRPGRPVWLGPTSYLHPARQRRLGVPPQDTRGEWPPDAEAAALHDAHEAFWVDGLFPGDPLRLSGVVEEDIDVDVPPYRVAMVALQLPEEGAPDWFPVETRIHAVTVIPRAGIAAVFWRGSIDLGADVMGESVGALVAALEDADAPARNHLDLAVVAAERWVEPQLALDDRPLLPPSLHHTVELPFEAPPDDDPVTARLDAAQSWALGEMGLDSNPFEAAENPTLAKQQASLGRLEEALTGEAVDLDEVTEIADELVAQGKERHEKMGFEDMAPPDPRPAERRDEDLEEEIDRRLSLPYQSAHEVAASESLSGAPSGLDGQETLRRMADARVQSPRAPLFWPPLELDEAATFGEALLGRLRAGDTVAHIDVSGAQVGDVPASDPRLPGDDDRDEYVWQGEKPPPLVTPGSSGQLVRSHAVRNRRVDRLLAEETGWRGIAFEGCVFEDSSFAQGQFENCEFTDCTFDRVNFSGASFTDCRFASCVLRELYASEPVLQVCDFVDCRLEQTSLTEAALRDVTFEGGNWTDVQWDSCVIVNGVLRETDLEDVSFTMLTSAYMTFERLSMYRVVGMGRGFPFGTFRDLEVRGSGFTACHFDGSVWERVRMEESGLTNGVFVGATLSPGCDFRRCDFTGASFMVAKVAGARFAECTMTTTDWNGADATGTWFYGSMLRGVHFSDAHLAGAVFCDADLRGAVMREEEIVGADFQGTVRSD